MCYRHLMTVCCLVLAALTISGPVPAQEAAKESASTAQPTRIEADNDAHVIRFFIDGKEEAFLDSTGLHVKGEIGYGGNITDYGKDEFERRAAETHGGAHAQ